MKRTLLYIVVCSAFAMTVSGQVRYFDERYVSSLSYLNPVLINPGATGMEDTHQIIAGYRNKWASFPDSPKTYSISYDGPVTDKLSFGAQFLADRNGSLTTSKVQGTIAYLLETADNKLNVGLAGEYIKHGLDDAVATNNLVEPGDILINERILGNGYFDVSVGAFGVYDNTITYGLVLPALVNSRIGDNTQDVDGRDFGYIFNVGYIYRSASMDAVFEPSVYVKQLNNVPFHADINLMGKFADDRLRGGFTYTVGADERVGFLVGTTFNALTLNYGYNLSRNEFQTYNNGSHEVTLRFDIGGSREVMTGEETLMDMEDKDGVKGELRKTIER